MLGLRSRACSGEQGVETEQMLDLGSPLARMGGGIQVTSPAHLFDFGLPHGGSVEGLPLLARGQVLALPAAPGTGPELSWQPHPPGRRGGRSAHFPQPGTDSLLETENSVGRGDPETGHRCDPWAEARSQGDRGRAGGGGLPGPHPTQPTGSSTASFQSLLEHT